MTNRSHPPPQRLGVGPLNAASIVTSTAKWAVEASKRAKTAPPDQETQPGLTRPVINTAADPLLN